MAEDKFSRAQYAHTINAVHALELVRNLRRCHSMSRSKRAPKNRRPSSGRETRKSWAPWVAGVIALAGVSAALLIYFRPTSPPPEGTLAKGTTNATSATRATNATSKQLAPAAEARAARHGDFLGAEACASCHKEQYDLWQRSTHGQAGAPIDRARLIARFDGQPLRFADATVIPTTNAVGRPVFLLEQSGGNRVEIEIDAAVGGGHMIGGGTQTFFSTFPDGTVRFLPFDFIRDENVWFVQLRQDNTWAPVSTNISLQKDLANWPPHRALGNAVDFSNCQNCHGSQVTVHYDSDQRRYQTEVTSLAINCESCHGPGRRHVELMAQPDRESHSDIGMTPLATLSKDESLKVCFQCHAHKVSISDEQYLPGDDLYSFFSIKLSHFWNNAWRPDGRVLGFGYQDNHLYSDCYLNGSMTCTDCHDPHSQHYRDNVGRPLEGRFDNRQCTGCHASKALDSSSHSHHAAESEGNRCTSCHMPFLQHQAVGRLLKFTRSDHTIPIPRPGFDEQLGVENACQKCHADRGLDWQLTKVREWYGEMKPHHPLVENLLDARAAQDLPSAAEMLLAPAASHPMAQAAGLSQFMQRYLRPDLNVAEPVVMERLLAFAKNPDLDLKALALVALQIACNADGSARSVVQQAKGQLGDDNDPLRNRWTVTADEWGTLLAQRDDFVGAIRCYQAALEIQPRNFVSLSKLALAYLRSNQAEECITALQQAIALKPYQATLHFQLGQAYAQMSRWKEARQALQTGLRYSPNDSMAKRMLELLPQ